MSGPTGPAGSGSRGCHARPTRPPCLRRSTGTSGSGRSASGLTTRPMPRSMARLAGFRNRRSGRHGLPHHRSSRLGFEPGRSELGRGAHHARRLVLRRHKPNVETYPDRRFDLFRVPGRGDLPPVRMTWYDGGLMPPAPAELALGRAPSRQRSSLRRQQGKDVPRLSRRHAPASCRTSCTTKPPRCPRR